MEGKLMTPGQGNTGNDRYRGKNGQGFLFHYNGRFH